MAIHKHSHSQSHSGVTTVNHRYSGTSSAFSASANPNEDWTKISDLAERRRIQNRIAQRNYRKKLKKRLEDLERRAASNSASPEQRPAELHRASPPSSDEGSSPETVSDSGKTHDTRTTPELVHCNSSPQLEDSSMFSHQYTRQLSTSPPPFSFSTYPSSEDNLFTYSTNGVYDVQGLFSGAETTNNVSSYAQSIAPLYSQVLPGVSPSSKYDFFSEEEINPFSMNYATLAGIEVPTTHNYGDVNVHVVLPESYPRY